MSVARFLARYTKPSDVVIVTEKMPSASFIFDVGSFVSLDGIEGCVAFLDGDRVVWVEEDGTVHFTLPKYLRAA